MQELATDGTPEGLFEISQAGMQRVLCVERGTDPHLFVVDVVQIHPFAVERHGEMQQGRSEGKEAEGLARIRQALTVQL